MIVLNEFLFRDCFYFRRTIWTERQIQYCSVMMVFISSYYSQKRI